MSHIHILIHSCLPGKGVWLSDGQQKCRTFFPNLLRLSCHYFKQFWCQCHTFWGGIFWSLRIQTYHSSSEPQVNSQQFKQYQSLMDVVHCPSVVSLGLWGPSLIALSAMCSHPLSGHLLTGSASTSWWLFLEDVKWNFQLTFFWLFWQLLVGKAIFSLEAILLAPAPRCSPSLPSIRLRPFISLWPICRSLKLPFSWPSRVSF